MAELTINHNAGFFSCCSVKLYYIIQFFNEHKRLPISVDCSKQFASYKNIPDIDLNNFFFKTADLNIQFKDDIIYHWDYQFMPYNSINFKTINPFIEKYFSPSDFINDIINNFILKYKIDFNNTTYVLYRGNDKIRETHIGNYDTYIEKANNIIQEHPSMRFMIQSDESQFIEAFISVFKNSFYIEEIPSIPKNPYKVIHNIIPYNERPLFGGRILASIICGAKCNHIITHSGNCGSWTVLYRGNTTNVKQYLNHGNINQWFEM